MSTLVAPSSAEGNDLVPSKVEDLARDPLRPRFHLLPARNWMNDPNGPIYWKGKYHMFYQYNPHAAVWGDIHWAHAVSDDMVRWTHRPVAMAPTPEGPDSEGVFSGTAAVMDGRVYMMYTGVKTSDPLVSTIRDRSWRETQCLAVADDDELNTFTKVPQPVIAAPPEPMEVNGFRDPSPWKQGDWWYTPIACGFPNRGGSILLYRSRDLRHWEFMHVFAERKPGFEAFMPWDVWECPEFFALGERHVLMFSTMGKAFWQTGRLDAASMKFHPEQQGILDYGSYYAPKTQLDAAGNRILWGWIQESSTDAELRERGWAGMMSLPRVMEMGNDGRLRFRVAEAVRSLRVSERTLQGDEARRTTLAGCTGEASYVASAQNKPWTFTLRGARSSDPWLTIAFDPHHAAEVLVDRRPIVVQADRSGQVELHMYVDGSVVELMVGGQIAWTKRFYYTGAGQDARLEWEGAPKTLVQARIWTLAPISRDRLTT